MKINFNAAAPGLNRLTQAFSSGNRQKAEENELLRLAQTDQRIASAAKDNADANVTNQRSAYLDDQPAFLSGQTGAPLPLAKKFSDFLKTGNYGQVEQPAGEDGQIPEPSYITETPEDIKPLEDKFMRALQTYSGLRGASTSNPEQIARSQGEYQQQGVTDDAVNLVRQGKIDQGSSLSQAGKIGQQIKRYDNIAGTGAVFNPATGEVIGNGNQLVDAFTKKLGKETTKSGRGVNGIGGKLNKLPVQALKLQQEELDAIALSSNISSDLSELNKQITSGDLTVGPVENLFSRGRNLSGNSTPNSRNFASFTATLEKLRNDSLRLNKGVQTEGDAQRAWNENFPSLNDGKALQQRLGEIQKINDRGVILRQNNVDVIRSNFGLDPLDTSGYKNQPSALGGDGKGPPASSTNIEELLKKY